MIIKFATWITLILIGLLVCFSGWLLMDISADIERHKQGLAPLPHHGVGYTLIATYLSISVLGIIAFILGALGYFPARKYKVKPPFIFKLSLMVGTAILILDISYFTYVYFLSHYG